jgi:hypothetical protein
MAGCLAAALAQSVYSVPIQVSDSLDPIVIAARAPSTSALFQQALHFSGDTLRPMRYVEARWLLDAADGMGTTYTAMFRGVHAAMIAALILVFVSALRVETWLDFIAAAVPLTVLVGLHTTIGVMREAYPVNHYAEVALGALVVLALARGRPRWWGGVLAIGLMALNLLLIESAVLIWLAIVTCAVVGLPGISRRTALAATIVVMAYAAGRFELGIGSPKIGSHGSGFGARTYSASELAERFGSRPLPFLAYNVVGGFASLVLSEPRYGVYSTVAIAEGAELRPVLVVNLVSSLLVTALVGWRVSRVRWLKPLEWSDDDRVMAVALTVIIVNSLMTSMYIKDEILSVAGVFYAVASYVAIRSLLERLVTAPPGRPAVAALAVLFVLASGLWTFRAAGTHFQLRQVAFTTRNEWVDVLSPAHPADWPTDPHQLMLMRRLKEEALIRSVIGPNDLPRWGEPYWVE